MNYSEFTGAVARRAGISADEAAIITRATMETLADRLTDGQAASLAGQLPGQLRQHLHKTTTTTTHGQFAESFGMDEFVDRVRARSGVDEAMADAGARAVMNTVGEAINSEEQRNLASQLPKEFWEMIRPGMRV